MFDNGKNVDRRTLQWLSIAEYIRESVAVIGRSQRIVGKSSEVCVVGTIVEGQSGVGLTHIDLILTVMLKINLRVYPADTCT